VRSPPILGPGVKDLDLDSAELKGAILLEGRRQLASYSLLVREHLPRRRPCDQEPNLSAAESDRMRHQRSTLLR